MSLTVKTLFAVSSRGYRKLTRVRFRCVSPTRTTFNHIDQAADLGLLVTESPNLFAPITIYRFSSPPGVNIQILAGLPTNPGDLLALIGARLLVFGQLNSRSNQSPDSPD